MKTLLTTLEAALQAAGYRVAIVPDPDAVPEHLQPPYLTLADGGTAYAEVGISEEETTLTVLLGAYYPAALADKAVQGHGQREGLAAYEAAVVALLADNLLGLADYEAARPGTDQPAQAFGTPEAPEYIRKTRAWLYTRLDT